MLGLPGAWAALRVTADSHPTIHAKGWARPQCPPSCHSGCRHSARRKTKARKPKYRRGVTGTRGQVSSSKDLSSGEKRKIVSYREEAAQTREKGRKRERGRERGVKASDRKTEGEKDGEKEKREE